MSRHCLLIVKDTHRALLYEDGVLKDVLPAGRYQIPRAPTLLASFFGAKAAQVEVVLIDIRGRDRTVVVTDLLTADGATISASFAVQYRVSDPRAAVHQVKNFEERVHAEAQTAARRVLRGMSLDEMMVARDEIGEELFRRVRESSAVYGLEVTGLDFKDLVVPEDLRKAMNRAALARRIRQIQATDLLDSVEPESIDEVTTTPLALDLEVVPFDIPRWTIPHATFRRDSDLTSVDDDHLAGLIIRRPVGHDLAPRRAHS